jgi:hypothetical protein
MPVSIGCAVVLTPGAAGPPDSGVIVSVPHGIATANGMPLATVQSMAQMVNSVSGVPYPLPISAGGSGSVSINGQKLLRMGEQIPLGSGVLMILGPPAAPFVNDKGAP